MKITITVSLAAALLFAALIFGSQADAQTPTPTLTPHPAEPEFPADAIRGASSPPSAPTGFYGKGLYQSISLNWKDVPRRSRFSRNSISATKAFL